jgi:nickel/cobalt transporter (NicO) family protein
MKARVAAVVAAVAALVLLPAGAASAHPLGNFTINHYNGLILTPDRVSDNAVIDAAELPTLQLRDEVRAVGPDAYAASACAGYAEKLMASVDGHSVAWRVASSSFEYRPGQAGLNISRLECRLTAPVDLSSRSTVMFSDDYLADRIGWREITARGRGIALSDSPVPATSVSDELRSYPNALLSSPLDEREVRLDAAPGQFVDDGLAPDVAEPGWTTRVVGSFTSRLDGLVGRRDLTVQVGLLAVGLCLLLGASHAALPGHGKTLMAAYMVGSRGTPKDAVLIGTTVTLSHTAGVLILGALFSASATFAGESVLSVLGVVSGLLVASVGVALGRSALRGRGRSLDDAFGHDHGHGHGHGQGHGQGHGRAPAPASESGSVSLAVLERDHDHPHGHSHEHEHTRGLRRITLVGMGIAGGLVPSPSALVVLLGAIALGRTVFGVLLVIAYGVGMAGTLTTVGYLVAKAPKRLGKIRGLAEHQVAARLAAVAPLVTAVLVLIVGIGLAARSAAPLV